MMRHNFIERSLIGAFSFLKKSIFCEKYASNKGFFRGAGSAD
jgi:hypothetical protein